MGHTLFDTPACYLLLIRLMSDVANRARFGARFLFQLKDLICNK